MSELRCEVCGAITSQQWGTKDKCFACWMKSAKKPDLEKAKQIAQERGWLTDKGWIWERTKP